jgi:hypothetical protein
MIWIPNGFPNTSKSSSRVTMIFAPAPNAQAKYGSSSGSRLLCFPSGANSTSLTRSQNQLSVFCGGNLALELSSENSSRTSCSIWFVAKTKTCRCAIAIRQWCASPQQPAPAKTTLASSTTRTFHPGSNAMLRLYYFSHLLIRRIAQRRAFDGFFQKCHVCVNYFLTAFADQIPHVFAHGIKGPCLRVRPREFGQLWIQ